MHRSLHTVTALCCLATMLPPMHLDLLHTSHLPRYRRLNSLPACPKRRYRRLEVLHSSHRPFLGQTRRSDRVTQRPAPSSH